MMGFEPTKPVVTGQCDRPLRDITKLELRGGTAPPLRPYQGRVLLVYEQSKSNCARTPVLTYRPIVYSDTQNWSTEKVLRLRFHATRVASYF